MKEAMLVWDKIPSGSSSDQDIYLISIAPRIMIRQLQVAHIFLLSIKLWVYSYEKWKI